jgi:hypothetical protein
MNRRAFIKTLLVGILGGLFGFLRWVFNPRIFYGLHSVGIKTNFRNIKDMDISVYQISTVSKNTSNLINRVHRTQRIFYT